MTRRFRALSILALAAPAVALSAQQPAKPAAAAPVDSCPIELMQPTGLGIANLQRSKLQNVKSAEEGNKVMKDAAKLLFDKKQAENPLGRDLLLAQFITFYVQFADSAKRGDIGFPGDKNQYVDLLPFADSLFTLIETAQPKCSGTTLGWRTFKPYTDRIKAAYAAVNAGSADTAEKLAKRAMILYHSGPQPYDVLWRVAKLKNDEANEIKYLQLAVDKLEGDTLNAAVRSNLLFNLGRIQQNFADAKTDKDAKNTLYRDAAKAYLQVLKEYPTGDEAPFAMQGISISAAITNDTSLTNAAVAIVKAAPDKYTDEILANAGVISVGANNSADAVAFFAAASKKNPYFRGYLYALAELLNATKQYSDMLPIVHKLIDIDPNNRENLTLLQEAFGGLANREAKGSSANRALTDSAVQVAIRANSLQHYLSYTLERGRSQTLLVGTVENGSKAARSYAIEFEFIGKDGAVLQKVTATVAEVAAGASGSFKVDIPIGAVLGVRYAELK